MIYDDEGVFVGDHKITRLTLANPVNNHRIDYTYPLLPFPISELNYPGCTSRLYEYFTRGISSSDAFYRYFEFTRKTHMYLAYNGI